MNEQLIKLVTTLILVFLVLLFSPKIQAASNASGLSFIFYAYLAITLFYALQPLLNTPTKEALKE